jgi:NAD(P)H-nitrite reductase large subunit
VPAIADRLLRLYQTEGRPGERFTRTVDRIGLEAIREAAGVVR